MYTDQFGAIPYIPGIPDRKTEPLSRYLPPINNGVVSTWLQKNIPQGSWLVDPFGASPGLAVEAARAGYKIIVTANNPIARFLVEMAAASPKSEDLQSVLAELAASYKGNERMEPHIRSLYNTRCSQCGQIISADAFLWEQGASSPYARIYTCPNCSDSGERPCTQFDIESTAQYTTSGLHRARAMERVIASTDPDRIHVEQALSVYTPRALYGLITLINTIEGLNLHATGMKYLSALMLYAFDQSNAMWRVPATRERRRQLSIPRHFRENNIWLALEQGIEIWSHQGVGGINPVTPISSWPNPPPETGGICIYEGRLVSLADSLSGLNIKAVCTAIPRPNQAFWTLSALWSGWLWGRDAVRSFKSVLHRQRYDWGWHTTALASIFKSLSTILDPSTLILGLMGEIEPGFIASALVAARHSGCGLHGIAIRDEDEQAQMIWKINFEDAKPIQYSSLIEESVQSAKNYLENRNEPSSYLNTLTSAIIGILPIWSGNYSPPENENKTNLQMSSEISAEINAIELTPSSAYSTIYNTTREALSYRFGFLRFKYQEILNIDSIGKSQISQDSLFSLIPDKITNEESDLDESNNSSVEIKPNIEKERPTRSSDVSESELMWLREDEQIKQSSLSDDNEVGLLNYLISHPRCTYKEIDAFLCEKFPGLYTPEPGFIQLCLESYGEIDTTDNKYWKIRPEDMPSARQKDVETANRFIHEIGERLTMHINDFAKGDISSVLLYEEESNKGYKFFLTVTANFGEIVLESDGFEGKKFLVIPGSRANIILHKLRRDPRLAKAFNPNSGDWQFLKLRHLKSIAENPLLVRENFEQLIKLDPITFTTPQLRLI